MSIGAYFKNIGLTDGANGDVYKLVFEINKDKLMADSDNLLKLNLLQGHGVELVVRESYDTEYESPSQKRAREEREKYEQVMEERRVAAGPALPLEDEDDQEPPNGPSQEELDEAFKDNKLFDHIQGDEPVWEAMTLCGASDRRIAETIAVFGKMPIDEAVSHVDRARAMFNIPLKDEPAHEPVDVGEDFPDPFVEEPVEEAQEAAEAVSIIEDDTDDHLPETSAWDESSEEAGEEPPLSQIVKAGDEIIKREDRRLPGVQARKISVMAVMPELGRVTTTNGFTSFDALDENYRLATEED